MEQLSQDPVEALLEKLSSGDTAAAEEVFRTYEPMLRALVRRMLSESLRPKFDSVDVVQSVWADLLSGFRRAGWRFTNAEQLRAFLIKATRHRFIDRARQNKQAIEHGQAMTPELMSQIATHGASAPETATADELWERMLAACPPAHRELLDMRRQGFKLAEIAEKTGLHESSVRRILYDLARRMACRTNPTSDV